MEDSDLMIFNISSGSDVFQVGMGWDLGEGALGRWGVTCIIKLRLAGEDELMGEEVGSQKLTADSRCHC